MCNVCLCVGCILTVYVHVYISILPAVLACHLAMLGEMYCILLHNNMITVLHYTFDFRW